MSLRGSDGTEVEDLSEQLMEHEDIRNHLQTLPFPLQWSYSQNNMLFP